MNSNDTSEAQSNAAREASYQHFTSLLAGNDQSIRRFVRSLLPSREGVDDVMQETALECWKKFDHFCPDRPEHAVEEFIRWACVIARYKAMSRQRDRSRDRLVFREEVIQCLADAAFDRIDDHAVQTAAMELCLQKLPDDQRRLILSLYSPGQSIAKLAAESGEKARRLYSRVNHLRDRLLTCVQQRLAGDLNHG